MEKNKNKKSLMGEIQKGIEMDRRLREEEEAIRILSVEEPTILMQMEKNEKSIKERSKSLKNSESRANYMSFMKTKRRILNLRRKEKSCFKDQCIQGDYITQNLGHSYKHQKEHVMRLSQDAARRTAHYENFRNPICEKKHTDLEKLG